MADMTGLFGGMMISVIFLGLLFAIASILGVIFWIFMLIDCIKRKFKEENEKIVWVLVLALTGVIGAIVYYFAVKRNKK